MRTNSSASTRPFFSPPQSDQSRRRVSEQTLDLRLGEETRRRQQLANRTRTLHRWAPHKPRQESQRRSARLRTGFHGSNRSIIPPNDPHEPAKTHINDAELIARQWNQQEMDMLYLRDQAAREGWLYTPEFRQATQDIRQGLDTLWQDLDSSAYDRFLYATGRPNRVQISNVIDSSPGQSIGLQAGDIVLNYGGSPIYSGQDLQSATTSGVPDETVIMQIIRDEALIELSIPRGPIGISMAPISVQPQS